MKISEIMKKMVEYSNGNLHDINHFMKVYSFAKMIGENEHLDVQTQQTLEIAAIVHDIACPLCRKKYGNTNGKYQEKEGRILAEDFLKDTDIPKKTIQRVAFLVGHHHSPRDIDGMDYQILLEADYLVNADESAYSLENISNTLSTIFKTKTGIEILRSIYLS